MAFFKTAAGSRLLLPHKGGGDKRTPQHLPPGDRGLPFRIGLLPPAALGIEAAERQVDYALVFDRAAFDHRPVGLGNPAMLEQKPQ